MVRPVGGSVNWYCVEPVDCVQHACKGEMANTRSDSSEGVYPKNNSTRHFYFFCSINNLQYIQVVCVAPFESYIQNQFDLSGFCSSIRLNVFTHFVL